MTLSWSWDSQVVGFRAKPRGFHPSHCPYSGCLENQFGILQKRSPREPYLSTRAPLGSGKLHSVGGGGGRIAPCDLPNYWSDAISKIQTPFDSPVSELSKHDKKCELEVTGDVTGQIKVRIFNFSGLVTSASTISMLSANNTNESAWIVSLIFVSIISCALWP